MIFSESTVGEGDVIDDCKPHAITCSSATALSAFSLFNKLEVEERSRIAKCMTLRTYRRNEFVISADQNSHRVFFLQRGRVRVCAYSDSGKQVHFEDLEPGMTFGELSALDGSVRSADCIVLEESLISSMSANDFNRIISEHETIRQAVLMRLVKMVRQHMQKVFEFSTASVSVRVRLELVRLAAVIRPDSKAEIRFEKVPTHVEIAARISCHREAVTREIKALESAGIITWKPGSHVIHALDRLLL